MALNDQEQKAIEEKLANAEKTVAEIKAENDKLKNPPKPDPKPEPKPEPEPKDLDQKVRDQKKTEEDAKGESKKLEDALKFNLEVKDFVQSNKDILPSEAQDILNAAEKEKYDTAIDKAAAIRTAVIKSFFDIQANIDSLTGKQKTQLEDYLKLTKKGREEKSEFIFENIFEPALEMVKKVKKMDELGKARSGVSTGTKAGDEYKQKLIDGSRKAHLGEK